LPNFEFIRVVLSAFKQGYGKTIVNEAIRRFIIK